MSTSVLAIEEPVAHGTRSTAAPRAQVALLLLVAAAFLLRLVGIERESLWIDEGWSLWFSRLDFGVLWGDAAKIELHPPLYYTLLKLWTAVFGQSDFALRALSALINALTAPLVYLSARWVSPHFENVVGLLSASLFELSSAQLVYSHEARGYALLVFAMAMTLASCVAIVRNFYGQQGSDSPRAGVRPWPFVSLGVGMAMLVWSHNVGALYAGVTGLWMGSFWLVATRGSRPIFLGLTVAAALFVALVARAVWTLLVYSLGNASEFWLAAPDGYLLMIQLSQLFGGDFYLQGFAAELFLRALLFAPWPIITLVGAARTRDPRVRWGVLTLLALSVGLALGNLVVTYTVKPIFMLRTALPAQVGWAVLSALSPVFVPARFRRAAVAFMSMAFVLGVFSYQVRRPLGLYKRPWREALFELARRAEPGATVYTMANRESLTTHYLDAAGRSDLRVTPLPERMSVPQVAVCSQTAEGCPFFTRLVTEQELATVTARLGAGSSTWLLLMEGDSLLPKSAAQLGAEFRRNGALVSWDNRIQFKDIFLYPPALAAARGAAR